MGLQQGFGMLTLGQHCDCRTMQCRGTTAEGQHIKPELVPIHRGKFTVDGHTWEV
jgi:hypothetical protein